LRSFPVGSHIIFYCSLSDGIEVIRILHGARDFQDIFES
jgi:toxin ParE1/3/4